MRPRSFEDCRGEGALARASTALDAFACKGKLGRAQDAGYVKDCLVRTARRVLETVRGADVSGLAKDQVARRDRVLALLASVRGS